MSAVQDLLTRATDHHDLFDGNEAMTLGWAFTESALNPWAVRFEKNFNYLPPSIEEGSTEWICRKTSFGLLQIMGQVARERGFDAKYLTELLDPKVNVKYAVRHLLWGKDRGDGSWEQALAAFNGGLGGNQEPPYRRQEYVDLVKEHAKRFET